jgi:hypothetical protein
MLADTSQLEILPTRDGVTVAKWERCFFTVYRGPLSAAVLEYVAAVRRDLGAELGRHALINIADPRLTGRSLDANTRRVMLTLTEEFAEQTICGLHVIVGEGLLVALGREIVRRMHWLGGPRVDYPSKVTHTVAEGSFWLADRLEDEGIAMDPGALVRAARDVESEAEEASGRRGVPTARKKIG